MVLSFKMFNSCSYSFFHSVQKSLLCIFSSLNNTKYSYLEIKALFLNFTQI